MTENQSEWCCDLCGNWNPKSATCECGCVETSWLPFEPSWRETVAA